MRATSAETARWRLVRRSSSYLASHDPRVHFGLGEAERVDEVVVVWPGGKTEAFGGFAAGAVHELRQGKGTVDPPPANSPESKPPPKETPSARR